jgi:UDP-N-acetyl-D-mannosaminuronic acid dehydrogenase
MPAHVGKLVTELAPGSGRVAVLGYAYLQDSDDTRNSPSADLVSQLRQEGYEVVVHDPFVREFQGDVMGVLKGSDCAVLMVAHSAYRDLDLGAAAAAMARPALVDARGFFDRSALAKSGFAYRVIGVAAGG